MSHSPDDLVGFAYGEDLEAVTQRSLGYRLLTACEPAACGAEVEALARWLQAAPYPEHWPARDLFCSVLLGDGRRLVALARYGLADHTPGQRRGGLELIGVLGPGDLDVTAALIVYRWLQERRSQVDDLHQLAGVTSLAAVVASATPAPAAPDPLPVLPVRVWQGGALLFAASTPGDPDHHLRLLEQGPGQRWQWLPLVGPDFPLTGYAQRGPLIAWTPHLAGVAVQLPHRASEAAPRPARGSGLTRAVFLVVLLAFTGLLAANLWHLGELRRHLQEHAAAPAGEPAAEHNGSSPPPQTSPKGEPPKGAIDERDRFVAALHEVLVEQRAASEWEPEQDALLRRYEQLVRRHQGLRVRDNDVQGKRTVAAVGLLAGRSADHVEDMVRKGLSNKGFSERVIRAACEHVREEIVTQSRERP